MSASWLLALVTFGAWLWWRERSRASEPLLRISSSDLLAVAALLGFLLPLYVLSLSTTPFAINADEVAFSNDERLAQLQTDVHWLGLGRHFHMPHFLFYWRGKVGTWLGGITIPNMRLVSALTGIAGVLSVYLLARLRFSPLLASAAAVVVGVNHAFLGLSRQALRNNETLLLLAVSLALLWSGARRNSRFLTFAGGVAAGATFLVYDVARITVVIWVLFAVLTAIAGTRGAEDARRPLHLLPIALAAFLLTVHPVLADTIRKSPESLQFSRGTSLWTDEGRRVQKGWVGAPTESAGVRRNILDGLTAFNNRVYDRGNVYPNHGMGNGFLDPITGAFLWIGLISTVVRVRRRLATGLEALMSLSFVVLWLTFALLINKAPNYSRMLITLAPVAFLTAQGLDTIGRWLAERARHLRPIVAPITRRSFALLALGGIVIWNQAYYWQNMTRAVAAGDDIGNTGRYISSRSGLAGYHFVLAADFSYPYYDWNDPFANWNLWMSFFKGDRQTVAVVAPVQAPALSLARPFTVFMGHRLWREQGRLWIDRYPDLRIHSLKTDGSILALEVR